MKTSIFLFTIFFFFASVHTTTVYVQNACGYTVWATAYPGGGKRLESGQTWTVNIPPGATSWGIWGRSCCSFNASGFRKYQTGDCDGALECNLTLGKPPVTHAGFGFREENGLDSFGVSLLGGFNLPMELSPVLGCSSSAVTCSFNITSVCPNELLVPGGCNNPCNIPELSYLCCTSEIGICKPTPFQSSSRKGVQMLLVIF